MYNGIELSASLMCVDWTRAGDQVRELETLGIDFLHIDIIDGVFAPDFTMGSSIIDQFRSFTQLPFDYHLMVEEPSRVFDGFKLLSGDYFSIHQEASRNLHRDLISIRKKAGMVGVAISPATSLKTLEYIIEDLDLVLIMTVNPGFKGQTLVQQSIRKVSNLKALIRQMNLKTKISVDGNVNSKTIPEMIAAGADRLVLGSSGLFRADLNLQKSMAEIHQSIDEGLELRAKNVS